ncbi:CYP722 protein [Hibiscus syriacus]|uniref:CYP722 protein n=1 Tax=Hibiscus syriacus TaxID=106335 RepID=A0A6A3AVW9_HIBSY|nr:uncharacterized protein LOC120121288 [Hibiscus syriacus]KAE8707933.1 CYP722 protein [Hibiscus syriacus]
MASFDFDIVKAEKEDALRRYNMEKKMKIELRLVGFLLTFFLLPRSWFPGTLAVAGDFLRLFVCTFNKSLYTFILVNLIVVVVYILSSQKQAQKQPTITDIYDEFVCNSRRSIAISAATTDVPATEETMVDKEIIFEEKAAPFSPEKELETTVDSDTIGETNISLSPVKQLTTTMDRTVLAKPNSAVSSAELGEYEHGRTLSMVSESMDGEVMNSDIESTGKSMGEMSNEEFQLVIDSFIAERKKSLLQENTAHETGRELECMPVVVNN